MCFLKIVEGLSGCHCLISFEWCVWVQRCMILIDDSGSVCGCGWVGGCVGVHGCVWWRRGWQKEHVLLPDSFDDRIHVSTVFKKSL